MSYPVHPMASERPDSPFLANCKIAQNEDKKAQPIPALHPTRKRFDILRDNHDGSHNEVPITANEKDLFPSGVQLEWQSRDNRKGRHVLILPRHLAPSYVERAKKVIAVLYRMCTVLAWWDVSWWIAVNFTFGSALFLIAGCFYWLPTAYPDRQYAFDSLVAGGVPSAIGGTMFEIGGILLVTEALNAKQTICFGWAIESIGANSKHEKSDPEQLVRELNDEKALATSQSVRFRPKKELCHHHHQIQSQRRHISGELPQPSENQPWKWWPTHHELVTHYIYEIGFLANFIMFIGATIFWITSILSLPGVFNNLSQGVTWGIYYLTYLVGAICFMAASMLYIIEAQRKWYAPAPSRIGWWIGVFNMIGSVGWTFAACVGYCSASWCVYQADLTLIWASAAFLIASWLTWYEAVEKWPVRLDKG